MKKNKNISPCELLDNCSKIIFEKPYVEIDNTERFILYKIIDSVFQKHKNKTVSEKKFYAFVIDEYINLLKKFKNLKEVV